MIGNNHCDGYTSFKRWCFPGTHCGDGSEGETWPSASVEACLLKCDEEDGCVAIAFLPSDQCITYSGKCTVSNDGVSWGFQHYKAKPYESLGEDRCVNDGSYKRWCKDCGEHSTGETWPSSSMDACQRKCFDELGCVAVAFNELKYCATYYDNCERSNDGVKDGFQYARGEFSRELRSLLRLAIGNESRLYGVHTRSPGQRCSLLSQCRPGTMCIDSICRVPPKSIDAWAFQIEEHGDVEAKQYIDTMLDYRNTIRDEEMFLLVRYAQVHRWRLRARKITTAIVKETLKVSALKAAVRISNFSSDTDETERLSGQVQIFDDILALNVSALENLQIAIGDAVDVLANRARLMHAKRSAYLSRLAIMETVPPSAWASQAQVQAQGGRRLTDATKPSLTKEDVDHEAKSKLAGTIMLYGGEAKERFLGLLMDDGSPMFTNDDEAKFELEACGEVAGVCVEAGAPMEVTVEHTLYDNKNLEVKIALKAHMYADGKAQASLSSEGLNLQAQGKIGSSFKATYGEASAEGAVSAEGSAGASFGPDGVSMTASGKVDTSVRATYESKDFGIAASVESKSSAEGSAEASFGLDGVSMKAEAKAETSTKATVSKQIGEEVEVSATVMEKRYAEGTAEFGLNSEGLTLSLKGKA